MNNAKILNKTWSLCPVCLKRIPAERVKKGKKVFLIKTCEEHGPFEALIWGGFSEIDTWLGGKEKPWTKDPQCPDNCGLCPDHQQKTCCIIVNVTANCNLNCRFCVADHENIKEPSFEEIIESLSKIIEKDKTLIQLSVGEPTIREDLPMIIKEAKKVGAKYVQLNSNGIRLGEDKDYVKELAEAGLSFVFMQFDGTEDAMHEYIRNRPLLKIKQQAIENCAAYNLGVTLVPTIVRGVNSQNIGNIIRYAIERVPVVRGVHFQPVTYMGRIPGIPSDVNRFTLDELVFEIQLQTDGLIKAEHLLPSGCDHPLCGFHGDFVVEKDQVLPLLSNKSTGSSCCCGSVPAEKNREFVGRRWLRPVPDAEMDSCCGDLHDMEYFLKRVKTNGFTITAMAFQDAGNIDLARLQQCSLHVYDKGRIVPFCSYNLTAWKK